MYCSIDISLSLSATGCGASPNRCLRLRTQISKILLIQHAAIRDVSEEGEIKIYDAFFNTREIKDNRAGVIIHEAAHLAGLEGESNANETTATPDSAEAVKNFCLCACGKLSLEEINREKESPENSENEELAYRPDQPRAPKGQSDGGQWISEGKNSERDWRNKSNESQDNSDKETLCVESAKNTHLSMNVQGKNEFPDSEVGDTKEQMKVTSENSEVLGNKPDSGLNDGTSESQNTNSENILNGNDPDSGSSNNQTSKGNANLGNKPFPKIDGKAPIGAAEENFKMGKIDTDRHSTNKSVDLHNIFVVKSYTNEKGKYVKGMWAAFDLFDEGYKSNANVSMIICFEFKGSNSEVKKIDVVYDAKPDENGVVRIDRVSVVNTSFESEYIEKIKSDSLKNKIFPYLDINIRISSIYGRPTESFKIKDKEKNKFDKEDIRYYAQEHACAEKVKNYAPRDGAIGGEIENYKKCKNEKEIFNGSVRVDLILEEVMGK